MSEYWVSKKQYWCKYCNIWVRDDAPSRRLHETGLKHQGQKERFIRDLYKGGERAKKEKEAEARQYARIEAAAKAAHSKDGGSYTGRLHHSAAASSSRIRPKENKDKWKNYSTAAQMGFEVDASTEGAFKIEQMVRGRDTKIGAWKEVTVGTPALSYDAEGNPVVGEKRKIEEEEDEEGEGFKFQHRDKRPVRDPYDEDEWDASALGGLKFKSKGKAKEEEEDGKEEEEEVKPDTKPGFAKAEVGEVDLDDSKVKLENGGGEDVQESLPEAAAELKPDIKPKLESLATEAPTSVASSSEGAAPAAGLFKKRRPPPSSRKK